jgi:hypothetical protein
MAARPGALHVIEVTFAEACAFIDHVHRHHKAPQGHKFSIGVQTDAGKLVGVATVGLPVAKALNDKFTYEVTRLATDGTRNACSVLYAAAWNSAKARGIRRMITYIQDGETGASLKASNWRKTADLPARPGWNTPSRPRATLGTENIGRQRWEITTPDAPPLTAWRDETRDETRPCGGARTCPECRSVLSKAPTGRPARYCGAACRQRAYRRRQPNTDTNRTSAST